MDAESAPAGPPASGSVSGAIMHFVAQRRKQQREAEQAGGGAIPEQATDGLSQKQVDY